MEKFYSFFQSDVSLTQEENKPPRLEGYAMKYDVLSHDLGGERHVYRQGVFGDTIQGADGFDTVALYNHDETQYLARVNNGTLRLTDDSIGLRFSIDLPNTTLGRDVLEMVKRRDIPGMSFMVYDVLYNVKHEGKTRILEMTKGKLREISVVRDPAFPFTELAIANAKRYHRKNRLKLLEI